jgi:ElaA protein
MQFLWTRLEQLSGAQWHEISQHREAVFIVEQSCAYQDADAFDQHAWHLVGRIEGEFAGYLRLIDAGCKHVEPSIGRVLSATKFRGLGLGKRMMQVAIRAASQHFPGQNIRISAQSYLLRFYTELGFEVVGSEYLEDGIPHVEMWLGN